MGSQTVGPTPDPPPSIDDLNDAYSRLLDDLNEAYWAANTLDAKDRLYGTIEVVSDIVTQLDASEIDLRNSALSGLVAQMNTVNQQLQNLQKQISQIISRISVAASVVSDIAKVLGIATKLIP